MLFSGVSARARHPRYQELWNRFSSRKVTTVWSWMILEFSSKKRHISNEKSRFKKLLYDRPQQSSTSDTRIGTKMGLDSTAQEKIFRYLSVIGWAWNVQALRRPYWENFLKIFGSKILICLDENHFLVQPEKNLIFFGVFKNHQNIGIFNEKI